MPQFRRPTVASLEEWSKRRRCNTSDAYVISLRSSNFISAADEISLHMNRLHLEGRGASRTGCNRIFNPRSVCASFQEIFGYSEPTDVFTTSGRRVMTGITCSPAAAAASTECGGRRHNATLSGWPNFFWSRAKKLSSLQAQPRQLAPHVFSKWRPRQRSIDLLAR